MSYDFLISCLIGFLALYRLADDIALMDGPAGSYVKLRRWLRTVLPKEDWVKHGINCPICWSFWLTWFVGLLIPTDGFRQYIILCLAMASGVTLVSRLKYGWYKPNE